MFDIAYRNFAGGVFVFLLESYLSILSIVLWSEKMTSADRAKLRSKTAEHISSRASRPPDPCAMVIFGASGDLAKRLIVPALYNLERTRRLPRRFALIGVARTPGSSQSWSEGLHGTLKGFVGNSNSEFEIDHLDESAWQRLAERMTYIQGDLEHPEIYSRLRDTLKDAGRAQDTGGNVLFYLAVSDRLFGPVVDWLGKTGLTIEKQNADGKPSFWRRVVIEKPFGHSLASACALNARLLNTLEENQIFRIDHFLGKDTVQNILAFRFGNGLFEPIWNRDRIDHVQITAAETIGVEQRGAFYEATGALRDMIPSHIFSLVSMVAMEPPTGFDAAAFRNKKADVLAAIAPVAIASAVRGQYAAGVILGKRVRGYRQEQYVKLDSNTETYVAMKLEIDNWRWAGVPFYVRTGKRLCQRSTEIAICFKQAPYSAFRSTPVEALPPNWLVLRIAPEEGISLQLEVKRSGPAIDLAAVTMDFCYGDWFPKDENVGYETLLYDVMIGDPTLFMRADAVEQGWRVVQPVLDAWSSEKADFPNYVSGSDGPKAAEDLLKTDGGRCWRPVKVSASVQSKQASIEEARQPSEHFD
jgi:glucose-6-phosphate 1-dehydrogenase